MSFASPQQIARIFPDTANLLAASVTRDDIGGESVSFTEYESDIPAQLDGGSGVPPDEVWAAGLTYSLTLRRIYLNGDWPVELTDRIEIGTRTFEVRSVHRDSWAIVTKVFGEEVEVSS